jgi:hypothetical protein
MSDTTYHVVFGKAGSACNWTLELDTKKARWASDVPEEDRCKRQGCGTADWSAHLLQAAPPRRRRQRRPEGQ